MVKNIALFLNSLGSGGAERVVSRISYELVKKYKVYIFLIENHNQFYDCAGQIVIVGKNKRNYRVNAIYAALNINRQIEKYNIDCVISFLDVPNIINSMFNRRTRKIISIRDCNETINNIKQKMCKYCFNKANAMISVSKELNEKAIERYNFDRNYAYTIENPYDVEEIERYANCEIEKDTLDFIQNHKTAVAVGRLNEQKGYEDLIQIFSRVIKKCPNAALVILGEGELKEELESIIREKKLENNIKLLGVKKNPFSYMAKCDVYVSTSKHEGFPNTLVEAMACGLPVIQTDCMTGPREILCMNNEEEYITKVIGDYGILIPSNMRDNISKAEMEMLFEKSWLEILCSKEIYEKYTRKSIERAKYYSVNRCIEKYSYLIEKIVHD